MKIDKFDQLVSSEVSVLHTHEVWQEKAFEIALRIIRYMHENKLTRVQLATAIGMNIQSLNRILQGKENLTLATIQKIEKALRITIY